jgi:hypothetical protein
LGYNWAALVAGDSSVATKLVYASRQPVAMGDCPTDKHLPGCGHLVHEYYAIGTGAYPALLILKTLLCNSSTTVQ